MTTPIIQTCPSNHSYRLILQPLSVQQWWLHLIVRCSIMETITDLISLPFLYKWKECISKIDGEVWWSFIYILSITMNRRYWFSVEICPSVSRWSLKKITTRHSFNAVNRLKTFNVLQKLSFIDRLKYSHYRRRVSM